MKRRRLPLIIALFAVVGTIFFACQSQELTSAKLYIQQQNYEKAEEFLLKAEQVEPQNAEIPFLLGTEIYGRQGEYQKMNAAFDRALAINEQYKDQIKQVRMKYWTQEFNSGAKTYNNAIQAEGTKRDTLLEKAIVHFETAAQILPSRSETYGSLATAYLLTNEIERAKETFNKALETDPDNFQVVFNYGKMLAEEGNKERAVELLKKAHKLKPENSIVVQLLANLYITMDKPDQALEMYTEALKQETDNPDLYFNKSILHIQLAQRLETKGDSTAAKIQFEDAVSTMEKAVELNPGDLEAKTRLGELYQELEMWDKAAKTFEEILEEQPENAQVMKKLAITVYRQGDPQRGQELLQKAKELEQGGSQ